MDSTNACDLLNDFIRQHQIVHVERNFVATPTMGWAVCVVYTETGQSDRTTSRSKVDYRGQLAPAEQLAWDQLREWRASRARDEGKKPYNIFTNAQLHYLISQRVTSTQALGKVPDWGDGRTEQYGVELLELSPVPTRRVNTGDQRSVWP